MRVTTSLAVSTACAVLALGAIVPLSTAPASASPLVPTTQVRPNDAIICRIFPLACRNATA